MEMTLRWYGSRFDTVTLKQIRQIPGVTGVITTLYDTAPGEVWSRERIRALKDEVEAAGLHISGIESVNIHDDIKTGAGNRDQYIANYIETLENLGKEDIHLVCYNFMPVFDWTRTELARVRPDGSTVLAYTQAAVDALTKEGCDFVYVHVEAPDEMGHQGSVQRKVQAIENLDSRIIRPVVEGLRAAGQDFRMVILPDHPTPIAIRTHTSDSVPYLLYDSTKEEQHTWKYNEAEAAGAGNFIEEGHTLIQYLFGA